MPRTASRRAYSPPRSRGRGNDFRAMGGEVGRAHEDDAHCRGIVRPGLFRLTLVGREAAGELVMRAALSNFLTTRSRFKREDGR